MSLKSILANWRTTFLGVGVILTAIAGFVRAMADGDPSTTADITILGAELLAGWALINSRDGMVSSEQSGAGIT